MRNPLSLVNKRRANVTAPRFAVADMGGGEYELTLYGDVMAEDPRDWWTGEKDGTPAVTSEAVNRELAQLREASHVTVRLNSCGGDLYAGLSIHDVLRSIPASVTVRVEGIAASAASVIACAGDEVVVTPGSIFMVHEGCLGLMGYYTAADVRALAADVEAGVRAMLGVYAAKTGKGEDELRPMVEAETWLVGQEIVDAGFADVLASYVEEDGEQDPADEISTDEDGETVIAGVAHDLSRFRRVPDLAARIAMAERAEPETTAEHAVSDMQTPREAATEEKGEVFMNISELREQHPDLVAEIEAAAAKSERDRIAAIDEVAQGIPADMVADAKYGHPTTAQELAFAAIKAQQAKGAQYLADAQKDAEESGAENVEAEPNGGEDDPAADEEEQAKKEVKQCADLFNRMKGGVR